MTRITFAILACLIAAPAFAQTAQPPQVDLSLAVQIYAQKFAAAVDEATAAEARVQTLMKQVTDLQKQIDDRPKDAPAP